MQKLSKMKIQVFLLCFFCLVWNTWYSQKYLNERKSSLSFLFKLYSQIKVEEVLFFFTQNTLIVLASHHCWDFSETRSLGVLSMVFAKKFWKYFIFFFLIRKRHFSIPFHFFFSLSRTQIGWVDWDTKTMSWVWVHGHVTFFSVSNLYYFRVLYFTKKICVEKFFYCWKFSEYNV